MTTDSKMKTVPMTLKMENFLLAYRNTPTPNSINGLTPNESIFIFRPKTLMSTLTIKETKITRPNNICIRLNSKMVTFVYVMGINSGSSITHHTLSFQLQKRRQTIRRMNQQISVLHRQLKKEIPAINRYQNNFF